MDRHRYHKEAFRAELWGTNESRRIAALHWAALTHGELLLALRFALYEAGGRGEDGDNVKALRGLLACLN